MGKLFQRLFRDRAARDFPRLRFVPAHRRPDSDRLSDTTRFKHSANRGRQINVNRVALDSETFEALFLDRNAILSLPVQIESYKRHCRWFQL